jgi:hypothetical protein
MTATSNFMSTLTAPLVVLSVARAGATGLIVCRAAGPGIHLSRRSSPKSILEFTKSLRKVACLDLGGLRIVSGPTFDAPARTAT